MVTTTSQKPRVLLIRLSSLGDLVLSTAALAPLQASGYEVALVTKSQFASLFEGQKGISEVFAFDKSQGEAEAAEALFRWVRARNFAFALDLQDSWRTWGWRRRLRRQMPVHVLRKPRLREWLILVFRLGMAVGLGRGGRARRFRLAAEKALGSASPSSSAPLTRLEASAKDLAAVRDRLPKGDFAVILPAGAWKSKEWPYFSELARIFAKKVPVVVLGGGKDQVCEEVAQAARENQPESRSLHGSTSLRESMAILSAARWVVGNDTGMVHVAEALGKDVAMIEGPTHPFMGFSPYREGSLVVGLPLLCRPCSKSGKVCVRFGSRLCLRGLPLEAVATRLRSAGFPC